MSSLAHGGSTSRIEVTNISAHGVWVLIGKKELSMPYEHFPWFKEVPVKSILRVEEQAPGHFYWPDIDVDLTAEIIEHPERFPLRSRDT